MKNKIIKRILMCEPRYFSSLNYLINPWMKPGTIDQTKAMEQWNSLVKACQDLGITVDFIEPVEGLPDMSFTTNAGIVFNNKVILGRFRHKERQPETPHFEQWYTDHGFEIIHLPTDIYLEGNGTMYFWNDKLFVGIGYRTDRQACRYLQQLFPDHEIIALSESAPAFYHLNIGFFPLDDETIFYYPDAFRREGRDELKKIVPNLIPVSEREMESFCLNSIVTGKTVIHQKDNLGFKKKLQELGYTSIEIDLSEFKKSGGGAQCLINILE